MTTNPTIENPKVGDIYRYPGAGEYRCRGWIHGSDCFIFSLVGSDSPSIFTPEMIAKCTRVESCEKCKRTL